MLVVVVWLDGWMDGCLARRLVRVLLPDAGDRDGPHADGRLGLDLQLLVRQPLHRQEPRPRELQHRGASVCV